MRFVERVTRLVKSDAHGIIDQLEERSLLLKQHLRDAEIELGRKRTQAEALEEEERRSREEAERLGANEAALDEDVELAPAGGRGRARSIRRRAAASRPGGQAGAAGPHRRGGRPPRPPHGATGSPGAGAR